MYAPKDFSELNPGSYINEVDKSFESVIISMKETGIQDPKNLSTYEFYNTIDFFEKRKNKN